MTGTSNRHVRMFLVEHQTGATREQPLPWEYVLLTGNVEDAIVALAMSSITAKAASTRLRIGKISPDGGVTFRELVRMGPGGKFLAIDPIVRRPGGGAYGGGAAPPLPTSPQHAAWRDRGDNIAGPDEDDGDRRIRQALGRILAGAFTISGSVAVALIAIALFLKDTPRVASTKFDVGSASDALVEKVASPAPRALVEPAPPPLPAAQSSRQASVAGAAPKADIWLPLFHGLAPGQPLDDVRQRFRGCFQAGDGSFYCEGDGPVDVPEVEILVARFDAQAPHGLTDIMLQSRPYVGLGSRDRAMAAAERLSSNVGRLLHDHHRTDRQDIPKGKGFWESLLATSPGAGTVETHWAPNDPSIAPYARIRLVGRDRESGFFVLQVSAPMRDATETEDTSNS